MFGKLCGAVFACCNWYSSVLICFALFYHVLGFVWSCWVVFVFLKVVVGCFGLCYVVLGCVESLLVVLRCLTLFFFALFVVVVKLF